MKKLLYTAIVLAFLNVLLCSCMVDYTYSDADKYTAGSGSLPADSIKSLNIEWIEGNVTVEEYDGNDVVFSEKSAALNDDWIMHYLLDGDTLMIKYAASGTLSLQNHDKQLSVKLPHGMELTSIIAETSSAGVDMKNICAQSIICETSSGTVHMSNLSSIDNIHANTSSGTVNVSDSTSNYIDVATSSGSVRITGSTISNELNIDTSSASADITNSSLNVLRFNSSSGALTASVTALESFYAEASSGDVQLTAYDMPKHGEVDLSSGDIRLTLPKDAGFTANTNTASGEFSSEFSCSSNGDVYTCGSGESILNLETSSGNIRINKLKK